MMSPGGDAGKLSAAVSAEKSRLRKRLFVAGKLAVSAACIIYVLRSVDISAFAKIFVSATWSWFMLAVILWLLAQTINSLRWAVLSRPLELPPGWRSYIALYFVGAFFNAFLPGVIGGDVAKAYYLSRDTRQLARSTTSVIMDRNVGVGGLLAVACLASVLYPVSMDQTPLAPILAVMLAGYVLLNWVILSSSIHGLAVGFLDRIGVRILSRKIHNLFNALSVYRRHPRRLGLMLALAAGIHLLSFVAIFFIGNSIGAQVPLHYYMVFIPIVGIVSMLPISIGGLGVRETAFLTLFGSVGLSAEQSVSLSLLWYVVLLLGGVPGLALYLRGRK